MNKLSSALLFCLVSTIPAFADVSYTSSAAYAAATSSGQIVIFEEYNPGFPYFYDTQDISSGQSFDGITYSNFTGGYTNADITAQYNSFSGLSLGADNTALYNDPTQTFFTGGEGITLTFSSPVNAAGIFYNVNPSSGIYGFTTNTGSSASTDSVVYDTNTFVFAGITTNAPFTSVTLYGASSYNVPLVTAATPEPSYYFILGIGLAALTIGRRIRRSAQAA